MDNSKLAYMVALHVKALDCDILAFRATYSNEAKHYKGAAACFRGAAEVCGRGNIEVSDMLFDIGCIDLKCASTSRMIEENSIRILELNKRIKQTS